MTKNAPTSPWWLDGYPHADRILREVAAARPLDEEERSVLAVLLAPAVAGGELYPSH